MTKTSTFLALILLTSAVGCAKSTDLGKMQEETIGVVKIYDQELVVLERRQADLAKQSTLLGPLVRPDAAAKLEAAHAAITEARNTVTSAPTLVATAAKSGNADELTRFHDETVEKLEHGITVARENLAAFDAYATAAAIAPAPAAAPPATTPPAEPPADPTAAPGGEPGAAGSAAPAAAGSAAPAAAGSAAPATANAGSAAKGPEIPCNADILLHCPEGQVDACDKQPNGTHRCVAK